MREVLSDFNTSNDDEVTTMLSFYHDLGVLVYFGGDDPILRQTVIIKPSWLVDMFSKLLSVKEPNVIISSFMVHQKLDYLSVQPCVHYVSYISSTFFRSRNRRRCGRSCGGTVF